MIWIIKVHLHVQHDPKNIGASLAKFDVRLASRCFCDAYHHESCRQLGGEIVLSDEPLQKSKVSFLRGLPMVRSNSALKAPDWTLKTGFRIIQVHIMVPVPARPFSC